ncbi:MAG: hypothetical protein ACE5ES_01940 [Candidatus Nanoarchaeia archaeon]
MEKTYNPFKLLGSYIGFIVGLILALLSVISLSSICGSLGECKQSALLLPVSQVVLGIVTGYLIHILFTFMVSLKMKKDSK